MPLQSLVGANKIPRKAIAHTLASASGTGGVVIVGDSAGATPPPDSSTTRKPVAVGSGSAQTIPVSAGSRAGGELVFDTVSTEADFTATPLPVRYVSSASARYEIAASVTITPTTGLESYALYMRRNGVCDAYSLQQIPNASDITLQFTSVVDVVAADEIEFTVKAKNTTAGSLDIDVVACSFTIYKAL